MPEQSIRCVPLICCPDRPATQCTGLLPPHLHCCLSGYHLTGVAADVIASVAYAGTVPVGIALASGIATPLAEVHAVAVLPTYRHRGIAAALMELLEQQLASRGFISLAFTFQSNSSSASYLTALLAKRGWANPKLSFSRVWFDLFFNAPWLELTVQWPEVILCPWHDLTPLDLEPLRHSLEQGVLPAVASPFKAETMIEPINSLAIKAAGHVVGWSIVHRLDSCLLRYSSLYTVPAFRFLAVPLLAESIKRHLAAAILWSFCEIDYATALPSWQRFVKGHLFPFAAAIEHFSSCYLQMKMRLPGDHLSEILL